MYLRSQIRDRELDIPRTVVVHIPELDMKIVREVVPPSPESEGETVWDVRDAIVNIIKESGHSLEQWDHAPIGVGWRKGWRLEWVLDDTPNVDDAMLVGCQLIAQSHELEIRSILHVQEDVYTKDGNILKVT